jgi:hypothetical protein
MQPLVVTLQQGDTREQVKGLLIPTLAAINYII